MILALDQGTTSARAIVFDGDGSIRAVAQRYPEICAAEARFLELLQSPFERVMVSTVSLDDEALVEASTFVDEIPRAKLPVTPLVRMKTTAIQMATSVNPNGTV